MRTVQPKGETELHWKDMREKELSHNMVDLRENHSHGPEQDPVNLTMAASQEFQGSRAGEHKALA